jgi:hypothetical protein
MSATGFLNSIGKMPEEEDFMFKKKIIKLSNGKTRVVFNIPDSDVRNVCRYCGQKFELCGCVRTEHVYNKEKGCCELCHETFRPNKTGPANNKFAHALINLFWFNRWVGNISDKHDIGYFEGFTTRRKELEDDSMLERTDNKIDRTWWLRPHFVWKKRARLNWIAVDKLGNSSFNWSGCVTEDSVNI